MESMIWLAFVLGAVVLIRYAAMAALERACSRPAAAQIPPEPRAALRAHDPPEEVGAADRNERLTERTATHV